MWLRTRAFGTLLSMFVRPHLAIGVSPSRSGAAHNFAKQLKALRWRTPMEAITAVWRQKPDLFHNSPSHYSPGPNRFARAARLASPAIPARSSTLEEAARPGGDLGRQPARLGAEHPAQAKP